MKPKREWDLNANLITSRSGPKSKKGLRSESILRQNGFESRIRVRIENRIAIRIMIKSAISLYTRRRNSFYARADKSYLYIRKGVRKCLSINDGSYRLIGPNHTNCRVRPHMQEDRPSPREIIAIVEIAVRFMLRDSIR
ncbi:hypothetical protein EVAR_61120_1 [Eumeta japonica]|uniref:Uncharacterized protein n=1 Tax=Eumeta variegata TaxID=151549 RepID=A0A4C1ZCB3_EUMVA|nr:hypothetical protein EVAR_61120_1 [Eumeta japonica]